MQNIIFKIPRDIVLILVGTSGAGKSTFANKHFPPTMVASTDFCRSQICDSSENQKVSQDAFEMFYMHIEKRIKNGYPVIADSTALKAKYRQKIKEIAKKYNYKVGVILFDIKTKQCIKNDLSRERSVGKDVIMYQSQNLEKTKDELTTEKYDFNWTIRTMKEIDEFKFRWMHSLLGRDDNCGMDIIGDVHGCYKEMTSLISKLGYQKNAEGNYYHPDARKLVFVGDLMDRGYDNIRVFEEVYKLYQDGIAYYVPGNHCNKLYRYLKGNKVFPNGGMEVTIEEIEKLSIEDKELFKAKFFKLYDEASPYILFDEGKLVVCHGGIRESYIGRTDKKVIQCCLYGPAALEKDAEFRSETWREEHSGDSIIVYGHTPCEEIKWINNTVNIDLSCVFGGKLAAMRYPELTTETVDSSFTYEPVDLEM